MMLSLSKLYLGFSRLSSCPAGHARPVRLARWARGTSSCSTSSVLVALAAASSLTLLAPTALAAGSPAPKAAPAQSASASASASAPSSSKGETPEQRVKVLMKDGMAAFDRGELEAARVAFAEAFSLLPHAAIAANLADAEAKLGLYGEAAEHFQFYLDNAPPDRADGRAEAEKRRAECLTHVARLTLSADSETAEFVLDGQVISAAVAGRGIWVKPGSHQVQARDGTRSGALKTVELTPGESQTLVVALGKASATTPATTPAADAASTGDVSPRTWVLVGEGALAAASLGYGFYSSTRASAADDKANSLRAQIDAAFASGASTLSSCGAVPSKRPAGCGELAQQVDDADKARQLALYGYVGAGLFATSFVVTYFVWPSKKAEAPRAALLVPFYTPTSRGVTLSVRF